MVAAVNTGLFVGAVVDRMQDILFTYVHNAKRRQLVLLTKTVATYARHRKAVQRSVVVLACAVLAGRLYRMARHSHAKAETGQRRGAQLDAQFVANMRRLTAIAVPGVLTREATMLAAHTMLLVVRTLLSVA
ncbi:ATP-binding cassette long-chain fatty acid transporter pxa2, partial [Coemansia guatemalensis]